VEENMPLENRLETRERAYREASRMFDYFVTGLSSMLFLSMALLFEAGQRPMVSSALDVTAIVLFAVSVFAGTKKLEYYVAVLGADYSIALSTTHQANMKVLESPAVLQDLNQTVERLSNVASLAHRVRNWFLGIGILAVTASRVLELLQA
jgi:hypothetical protein